MNYRLLSRVFGLLLLFIAAGMGACWAFGFYEENFTGRSEGGADALAVSASITLAVAVILLLTGIHSGRELLRKEAVVVVGLGWFLSASFGMLPYLFCEPALSIPRAFFESASGFTTTGATVIADLDPYPRSILLWRALTQWLGGLGILVLFVALLSYLGAGGKSLFRVESSARVGEKTHARIRDTALRLWEIYLILSTVCAVGLRLLGMTWFEAVTHTMTAVSTGGFGIYNTSIAHFDSAPIDAFLTVIMAASAVTFFFYAAALKRNWHRVRSEEEGLWFLGLCLAATALVTFNLLHSGDPNLTFWTALRHASFQVVSIVTTTGFGTQDYDRWPGFSIAVLLGLMIIGGCSGSTAGGIKVARFILFFKTARREIVAAFRPRQIFSVRINRTPAESSVGSAIFHIALFGACLFVGTLAIAILEPAKDFDTCFSATTATLFNIGPGIAGVGPASNYADFHAYTYFLMAVLMVMGRLELLAVLVLFVPSLWRKY